MRLLDTAALHPHQAGNLPIPDDARATMPTWAQKSTLQHLQPHGNMSESSHAGML